MLESMMNWLASHWAKGQNYDILLELNKTPIMTLAAGMRDGKLPRLDLLPLPDDSIGPVLMTREGLSYVKMGLSHEELDFAYNGWRFRAEARDRRIFTRAERTLDGEPTLSMEYVLGTQGETISYLWMHCTYLSGCDRQEAHFDTTIDLAVSREFDGSAKARFALDGHRKSDITSTHESYGLDSAAINPAEFCLSLIGNMNSGNPKPIIYLLKESTLVPRDS